MDVLSRRKEETRFAEVFATAALDCYKAISAATVLHRFRLSN
jgi:hypothetical protein